MTNPLLTLAEVAKRLRVSHDTVYRLAASGKLPGIKVGRAWRFEETVIQPFVAVDEPEAQAVPHAAGQIQGCELISTGLLESIVGELSDVVLVINEHGHLVYLNQFARQFLELGPTEAATRDDLQARLQLYDSDGRTPLEDGEWPCARALRGETVPQTEYLVVTPDGRRYWMSIRATPLSNPDGKWVGCVCIFHNMTQDRQREHQLRLTEFSVEHSPDAVFWVRPDGGVDYVNDRARRSLGYSIEELLRMSVPDFDPDVAREKWPDVWAAVKAQKHFHIETRHRTKLGRVFPVEVLASHVEYEGAEYAVCHVRDISSRRRADAQLKESEARFQRAIAGSRDGIWDWEIQSGAVWFSPQYIRLLGYGKDDVVPGYVDTWSERLHPEDRAAVMSAVDQHLAGIAPYDIEYRLRLKSGEYRWFRARGQAYWDEDGRAVRMTGILSDIAEQRRVLEVLEHQRRRKQMLIKHTPAAVAMLDREMRYIIHSDRWLKDYGLDGQSLIGRSHYEVFPDLPERWKDIHRDCLGGQIRECKQDRFVRADGTEVWLEWAIHPWTDDDGDIGGIVMFTNVITQRILTERALEKARQNAESASHAKSEFLANMSHEIRTPLTAILGFADQLRSNQSDPESIELCSTIERNGAHLMELINDILDLSKVEAGRIDIHPERCSPTLLGYESVRTLQGRADQKRVTLIVEVSPEIPAECLLDILRIRQMLINLLGNAIKFTSQGSVTLVIRTAVDAAGSWLEFAVQDTGIGIPSDKLGSLFQPFSQIDSSTTRTQGGTGLGLCISRRLARLCGGDITVVSHVNVGSTFTLRLPLVAVPLSMPVETTNRRSRWPSTPVSEAGIARKTARILVADDSADNRRLLDFIFRKANHEATFVENGQQLVDRLRRPGADDDFDVIVIDMQMPVLDGYSAARLLRQRGCDLPLIALTANVMDDDRNKCLNAGCDDFATKPINREAFLETVCRWSGRRATNPSPPSCTSPPTPRPSV